MFQINQKLTNPIDNIRQSNIFVHLEALISNKEDNLPQGVWIKKEKQNWHEIIDICKDILTKHNKDLQVMAWLLEANFNIKKYMFASIIMLDYMIDNHWPNDIDLAYKIIFNLNKSLVKLLPNRLFIYDNYTLSDFQNQNSIPTDSNQNLNYFSSDQEFISDILNNNNHKQNWKQFAEKFIEICERCEHKLQNNVFEKTKKILNDFIKQINDEPVKQEKNQEIKITNQIIKSRAHAYKLIKEITEFLKNNDPHSATPYLLQKASEWENKSFADILDEFNDPIIIKKIFQQN